MHEYICIYINWKVNYELYYYYYFYYYKYAWKLVTVVSFHIIFQHFLRGIGKNH
jgi:hypothetical protein